MNRSYFRKSFFAAAMFAFTGAAQAALISTWSYSVASAFVTAGAGAPTFVGTGANSGVAPLQLDWGNAGTPGSVLSVPGTRSGIRITSTPAVGSVNTNGAAALTNLFTHYNNVINGDSLLTATINATVQLTPSVPAGPALPSSIQTFQIRFVETPNGGPCAVGVPPCPDIFVLGAGSLNQSFTLGGDTYFVSIFEATNALNPLPAAACTAAGAAAGCIGFTTLEGAATPAQFAFLVTSTPVRVPEPGVLALLAITLLGVGGARKLKRRVVS